MHSASGLEVLFSPMEFEALPRRDLSTTVCVVCDVLRATSTMVAAVANGAASIVPVADIAEALAIRAEQAGVLLGGERDGVRIPAERTGSIPFDLGNSPREYAQETVGGRTVVMTTTNGTRALRACAHARRVLVGSFLNLQATADGARQEAPAHLLLVCGGTREQVAYEDALCAGALCELLWATFGEGRVADSARIARASFHEARGDILAAISRSANGRRLLAQPALRDDVPFCARRDVINLVVQMDQDGHVRPCSNQPTC